MKKSSETPAVTTTRSQEPPKESSVNAVDISRSTVRVDSSRELSNLYVVARRAKNDNNAESAAKYYDMILLKDPTSWEAYFYTVYFKAAKCKIAEIRSSAISVTNCLNSVFIMVKQYVPDNQQLSAVNEIAIRCNTIATLFASSAKNHYDGIDSSIRYRYSEEYHDNVNPARDVALTCGTQIDRVFGSNPNVGKLSLDSWQTGFKIHDSINKYSLIDNYIDKISNYDWTY